jgi:hypothetical protein
LGIEVLGQTTVTGSLVLDTSLMPDNVFTPPDGFDSTRFHGFDLDDFLGIYAWGDDDLSVRRRGLPFPPTRGVVRRTSE